MTWFPFATPDEFSAERREDAVMAAWLADLFRRESGHSPPRSAAGPRQRRVYRGRATDPPAELRDPYWPDAMRVTADAADELAAWDAILHPDR